MGNALNFKKRRLWVFIGVGIVIILWILPGADEFSLGSCVEGNGNRERLDKTLPFFHSVVLKGAGIIYVEQDDNQQITVEGDDNLLPLIEFKIEDDKLIIGHRECLSPEDDIEYYITTPQLKSLTLAGSGNIESRSEIEGEELTINLMGSGDLELDVEVETLRTSIMGTGNIEISGAAETAHMIVRGSGDIEADDLTSKYAFITISGSGDVTTEATEELKVRIDGSGDVEYAGSPERVDIKVNGSGGVKQK